MYIGGKKEKENVQAAIKNLFRKTVQKDTRLKNAYLLVHSENAGIHINSAEGMTGDVLANPDQPNYMASCGKLFTATITGILHEKGKLSFNDSIAGYLDQELAKNLHVHKGKDYTGEIHIRHLLNQTSGLPDDFWPLVPKLLADPDFSITPQEAVTWAKNHLRPRFPPGTGYTYTDTNYHILGLIIEHVTGMPFHEVLKEYIYAPLMMKHSSMLQSSEPIEKSPYPVAGFYHRGIKLNEMKGFAGLDYAGGGVVAPTEDLLKFMKALVSYALVTQDTLETMMNDKAKFSVNFDYGYGIWQLKPIPLLIPKKFVSWGVLGSTGAFMFYHPALDAYLIGNFNDSAYERKSVRFMMKIMNELFRV